MAYTGRGINHEDEEFDALVKLSVVGGGNGVLIEFRATGIDDVVFHDESVIVAPALSGEVTYLPISSNVLFVLPHEVGELTSDSVSFVSGDFDSAEGFRERIDIGYSDSLTVSYSWGIPGEDFGPRSSVNVAPTVDGGASRR